MPFRATAISFLARTEFLWVALPGYNVEKIALFDKENCPHGT